MSQYYILKPAVDTDETGHVFPAVESYDDYDFKGPRSVHKIKFNEFPDFEPDIRFRLAKGAKLCDVLGQATIASTGLLVSSKFQTFIKDFLDVPFKFYPCKIESNGVFYQYFWMQIISNINGELIDFENSIFFVRKFSKKLESIKIMSFEDLKEKNKQLGPLKLVDFESIVLFPNTFNIITLPFRGEIYIKSSLANLIQKQNFSGVTLVELHRLH